MQPLLGGGTGPRAVASDFMGDLACDSERVTMEGSTHSSFICEDDPVLLEEALPPAGQTLCSAHHFRFSQLRNKERQRKWWELPGSLEPKESSTYEPSPSFLSSVRLVSALKGGRERSGEASPPEVRRVKWTPDVYDPPITSVDHLVKSHQQRPRSRKKERTSRNTRRRGSHAAMHDAALNLPALQDPGPSPDDFGDMEPEVLDYDTTDGQESMHGSGFVHDMLDEATSSNQASSYSPKMSFPAAEAS